jgi:hypothetical protein
MKPVTVTVTDLALVPLVLTIKEIAGIYRVSVGTIRRGLQSGTFSPQPWKTYPYRWRRDDVIADLSRPRDTRPHKPHGFAATRRRTAKATIDPPKSTRTAS